MPQGAGRFVFTRLGCQAPDSVGSALVRESTTTRAEWIERHGPFLAAVVFFLSGVIWLGSSAHFHGDERYYTDSALRMLERGDPWTPMWADGTVRANKPLLTYWIVMASFATSGVSLFVARLPFLVAGALLVWLTGRLAATLFPRERAAPLLAALVLACDYEVVTLARRSTPDILLMLFTTASLFGLSRIVVAEDRSLAARAWFWIGGGLAIATKGGLGLVVLGFGTAVLFATRKHGAARRSFPIPVCLLALAVAAVGMAPSLFLETREGTPSFVDDQVGARLAGSAGEVGRQLIDYATSLAKHFLPWTLLLASGAFALRSTFRERWGAHRRALLLAVCWAALLWVVFSFSNTHRGRYLAPAHALLAAAMAPFLLDVARSAWGRRLVWCLGGGVVLVSTLGAVLVGRVDLSTGVALTAPLLFFLSGCAVVRDEARASRGLALALLALFALAQESVLALVDPSPLPFVVERIEQIRPPPKSIAIAGLPDTIAGQLRLLSGGQVDPVALPDSAAEAELARFALIVVSENQFDRVRRAGLSVEPLPQSATDLDLGRALAVFWHLEPLDEVLFVGPRLGIARVIGTYR